MDDICEEIDTNIEKLVNPNTRDAIIIETITTTKTTTTTKRIHCRDPSKYDLTDIQNLLDDKPCAAIENTNTNSQLSNHTTTKTKKPLKNANSPLSSTKLSDEVHLSDRDDDKLSVNELEIITNSSEKNQSEKNQQNLDSPNLSRISNVDNNDLITDNQRKHLKRTEQLSLKRKMPKTPQKYKEKRIDDLVNEYISMKSTNNKPKKQIQQSEQQQSPIINNDLSAILEGSTELIDSPTHSDGSEMDLHSIAEVDAIVEEEIPIEEATNEKEEEPTQRRSSRKKQSRLSLKSVTNQRPSKAKMTEKTETVAKRARGKPKTNPIESEPVGVKEEKPIESGQELKKSKSKASKAAKGTTRAKKAEVLKPSTSNKRKRAEEKIEKPAESPTGSPTTSQAKSSAKSSVKSPDVVNKRKRVETLIEVSTYLQKPKYKNSRKRVESEKPIETPEPTNEVINPPSKSPEIKTVDKQKRTEKVSKEPIESDTVIENKSKRAKRVPEKTLKLEIIPKRSNKQKQIAKKSSKPIEPENRSIPDKKTLRKNSPKSKPTTPPHLADITNEVLPMDDDAMPGPSKIKKHLPLVYENSIKLYSPSSRDRFRMDDNSNDVLIPSDVIKSKLKKFSKNMSDDLLKRIDAKKGLKVNASSRLVYVPATELDTKFGAKEKVDFLAGLGGRHRSLLIRERLVGPKTDTFSK